MSAPNFSALALRRIILEQSKRAHVGHIGSALSVADLVATLYGGAMRIESPEHPERDRFVLSKGHAALAVYAALHLRGWLSLAQLNTFCGDGSQLGVHPEVGLRGVDFSTGSLGQGLSMGVGAAFGARIQKSNRRTWVLMSDAETNEGAVWEAVQFAAQHRLSNLVVLVDFNRQQALGYTRDILDQSNLSERFRAFGWNALDVEGHNPEQLQATIDGLDFSGDKPHVLVAHTTFGKGVSFMENTIKWHYWPMNDAEYAQAVQDVEAVA